MRTTHAVAMMLAASTAVAALTLRAAPVTMAGTMADETTSMTECEALTQGGPDWPDDQEHPEDFADLVSEACQKTRNNTRTDVMKHDPDSVQFLHVGKTAGTSTWLWLRANGVPAKHHHLVQVTTDGKGHQTPCNASKPQKWLISVRDPIERAISAFNWRNPRNGNVTHGEYLFSEREVQLYDCFDTFNKFAEMLHARNKCGRYARRAFQTPWGSEHLGMGLAWYLEHNLDCILQQDLHLVRTESIQQDLEDAAKWLNLTNPTHVSHRLGNYPLRNQTKLTSRGRNFLMEWLRKDYAILKKLERTASNGRLRPRH